MQGGGHISCRYVKNIDGKIYLFFLFQFFFFIMLIVEQLCLHISFCRLISKLSHIINYEITVTQIENHSDWHKFIFLLLSLDQLLCIVNLFC